MARPGSPSEFIWSGRSTESTPAVQFRNIDWNPAHPLNDSSIYTTPSTAVDSMSDEITFCTCPGHGASTLQTAHAVHLRRGAISPRIVELGDSNDEWSSGQHVEAYSASIEHPLPSFPRPAQLLNRLLGPPTLPSPVDSHYGAGLPPLPRNTSIPMERQLTDRDGAVSRTAFYDDPEDRFSSRSWASGTYTPDWDAQTGGNSPVSPHYHDLYYDDHVLHRRTPSPAISPRSRAEPIPGTAARIHTICLSASRAYLRGHITIHGRRGLSHQHRDTPYSRLPRCLRHLYNRRLRHSRYAPTQSLLHNAGAICALIWRAARQGREVRAGVERSATERMRNVMRYAERVFEEWKFEEGDVPEEVEEFERWEEHEDVLFAGEEFCVAIGDEEAADRVRDVVDEVQGEEWEPNWEDQEYDENVELSYGDGD